MSPRLLAVLAVAFALGFGVAAMFASRPRQLATAPSPPTATATAPPTATATPDEDDPRVFVQPLVAGCGVAGEAYVVSHGGGIAWFDGRRWRLIDDTLRDLNAIACGPDLVVAVGDGGRATIIDLATRRIAAYTLAEGDLRAVARSSDVVYAVGARQTVLRLVGGRWERLGRGDDVDVVWRSVAARGPADVWLAGDRGALFRYDGRTFANRSLEDGTDLLFVGTDLSLVAADGRLFEIAPDALRLIARETGLRAAFAFGGQRYLLFPDRIAAGDDAVPTGLSCTPRAMFATTDALFVVASDGGISGIARSDRSGRAWTKLGRC